MSAPRPIPEELAHSTQASRAEEAPILEVCALSAGYPGRPVLREATFSVSRGELWAILGPNGAGKSTLLKACLRLISASSGRILLLGRSVELWGRKELARKVAWVPQDLESVGGFTALEVVLMGRSPHLSFWSLPSRLDETLALSLMRELGIMHLAARPCDALSGGERRLLLLARALAQRPRLLLLDEPTAFLDVKHQVHVLRKIRAKVNEGLAALAVVHDVNHALAFADRVLLLKDGAVLGQGTPSSALSVTTLEQLFDLPMASGQTANGQKLFTPLFAP
jgi:iron complex transport system ATP-binding protein